MMTGNRPKAIMCWSGGKDSAMALHRVLSEGKTDVVALLTTLHSDHKRVSMHGVREALLEEQAKATGIPLIKMFVREGTNEEYERNMETLLLEYKAKGVSKIIFGDIFLEDLRAYRENNLSKVELTAEFPLWKNDTRKLAQDFIRQGFRTITCCVNDASLDENWCGKEFDADFLRQLPANADPCGENGEFHTFCFAGPVFSNEIQFEKGETVYRPLEVKTADGNNGTKGFWYCDLMLS